MLSFVNHNRKQLNAGRVEGEEGRTDFEVICGRRES